MSCHRFDMPKTSKRSSWGVEFFLFFQTAYILINDDYILNISVLNIGQQRRYGVITCVQPTMRLMCRGMHMEGLF